MRIILIIDIKVQTMKSSNMNLQSASEPQPSKPLRNDPSKPIDSDSLFTTSNEVLIQHQGEHYRLRRTRNGKLILTK